MLVGVSKCQIYRTLHQQISEIKSQADLELVAAKDKKRILQELQGKYTENLRKQKAAEQSIKLKMRNIKTIEQEIATNDEK